ncbi:UNVERIFIED_CONTAM: hypothetical protein FKN15_077206 [Acipenser sinensis]
MAKHAMPNTALISSLYTDHRRYIVSPNVYPRPGFKQQSLSRVTFVGTETAFISRP